MTPQYFSAIVADNQDPDQLGRLMLQIPGYTGDETYPEWVSPRVTAGSAPGAGWWFIPPVDAIVIVELDAGGELRWTGAEWGDKHAPPEFLLGNYPRRAGFTSPEGSITFCLDEDDGVIVLVEGTLPTKTITFRRDPQLLAAVERLPLFETFIQDLATAVTPVFGALTALGFAQPDGIELVAKIATSIAAGAPYLSTLTKTE